MACIGWPWKEKAEIGFPIGSNGVHDFQLLSSSRKSIRPGLPVLRAALAVVLHGCLHGAQICRHGNEHTMAKHRTPEDSLETKRVGRKSTPELLAILGKGSILSSIFSFEMHRLTSALTKLDSV